LFQVWFSQFCFLSDFEKRSFPRDVIDQFACAAVDLAGFRLTSKMLEPGLSPGLNGGSRIREFPDLDRVVDPPEKASRVGITDFNVSLTTPFVSPSSLSVLEFESRWRTPPLFSTKTTSLLVIPCFFSFFELIVLLGSDRTLHEIGRAPLFAGIVVLSVLPLLVGLILAIFRFSFSPARTGSSGSG